MKYKPKLVDKNMEGMFLMKTSKSKQKYIEIELWIRCYIKQTILLWATKITW